MKISHLKFSAAGGRMVKYKGITASIAPLSSVGQKIVLNPGAFALIAGITTSLSAIIVAGPGESGICRESQDLFTFECSGPANPATDDNLLITPQKSGDRLIVNTTEGFSHENTNAEKSIGIEISDQEKIQSGITFTDNHQSYVKSTHYAFAVESHGKGDISISSNGEFYSEKNVGAIISNNGIANVDAKFHKVTGRQTGLYLNNKENVTSTITTTGEIRGNTNDGILTTAEGGELTLTVNGNVTGRRGIASTGFTNSIITTRGEVVGKNLEGIFSNVTSAGTDNIINAHNVTGRLRGILADNYGSGDTNITTTGLVTGETEHGIWAAHKGKDLNIQVNDTLAKQHGIHVENTLAKGNITVSSTGKITADETGVYVNVETPSYHTAINVKDITAGYQGIYAKHKEEGNFSITVSGDVKVDPAAFKSPPVITEDETRCIAVENKAQCGVIEIDTKGDATVDVSGNISSKTGPAPQIVVDLTGIEGGASLIIRDKGQIHGQSVTTTEDADDELIFAGNTATHNVDLATIGNKNSEFAFIGFDNLIKQDAGTLSLHGAQSDNAFHSAEFRAGDVYFHDAVLLLNNGDSIVSVMPNAKITIGGTVGSDITGSVINHGRIFTKAESGLPDTHILDIGGTLTNTGIISTKDNFVGNKIVVQGNYLANNDNIFNEDPVLILEATLDDDSSPTDKLIIQGNSSGHTAVEVVPFSAPGEETIEGIPIIEVSGESNGTFALNTGDYKNEAGEWALIGGAYSYTLKKSGKNWHLTSVESSASPATPDNENPATPILPTLPNDLPDVTDGLEEPDTPVVQNPPETPKPQVKPEPSAQKPDINLPQNRDLQPGVAIAMAASEHFLFLNRSASLQQRAGARHDNLFKTASKTGFHSTSWVDIDDIRAKHDEKTTESKNSHIATKIGFGVDFVAQPNHTQYVIGLNGYVGKSGVKSESKSGYGNINTRTYGIGAAGTAYISGTYIDLQAKYHHLSSDYISQELGVIAQNQKGKGYALSLGAGHKIKGDGQWQLTPQVQLNYSKTSAASFEDFKKK